MIFPFSVVLVVVLIFRQWFIPGYIAGGDLWPMARTAIESFSLYPFAWNSAFGGGLGAPSIPFLWNYFQYATPLFFLGKVLGLSWEYVVRFGYLFPFLILSLFSSYSLAKRFLHVSVSWLAPIIYTTNTYSLMIIAGGQTGVAMAYAFAPFVLFMFIQTMSGDHRRSYIYNHIINGLALALLVAFDLRIAYLMVIPIALYGVLEVLNGRLKKFDIIGFFIPIGISALLHAYWIVPTLLFRGAVSGLGSAYTDLSMLKFLSFADFSHALSLLHPNWPENIFGKVYFLQPEFLIVPLLAFGSLLFITRKTYQKHRHFIFFSLLAIIGAFFAKGVNGPFGDVYRYMYRYIPGFIVFRDPTKFYVFLAIAYSVLIPFTIHQGIRAILSALKGFRDTPALRIITVGILIVSVSLWLITIRQAVTGSIGGTLQHAIVPEEYRILEKTIAKNQEFFRTFWMPSVHRLSFQTLSHPALDAMAVTGESSISGILQWLKNPLTEEQLARWSVRYVIVPIDTAGEFFTTDYLYDRVKRDQIIDQLDQIPWLVRDGTYAQLAVWEVMDARGHSWIEGGSTLSLNPVNPVTYSIRNATLGGGDHVIFSERYNPFWFMKLGDREVPSTPTIDGLNQFVIPRTYTGFITISFLPQRVVDWGLYLGIITLIGCFVLVLKLRK